MTSLILLGIKHCGKTTQGKLLSKHFACPFFDTDNEIRILTGRTPRELYTESGNAAFSEAEANACRIIAEKIRKIPCYGQNCNSETEKICSVIATGGGICENPVAMELLRPIGTFVFLNTTEEAAAQRIVREITIAKDGTLEHLPAYIAKEHPTSIGDVRRIFHSFYVEREKKYTALGGITVNLKHAASKTENMNTILDSLRQFQES